jgi:hypothetical protein
MLCKSKKKVKSRYIYLVAYTKKPIVCIAVAKDLDYFELTVDELFAEKTDLLQQLEDEKVCINPIQLTRLESLTNPID